jgi:hypothetical protein
MEKNLTEVLEITTYLFKTAKRMRKKYGQYHGVSIATEGLESAAMETMCGTPNVNAFDYIECYYKGVITIEELLRHLAYPLEKDVEEGYYNE